MKTGRLIGVAVSRLVLPLNSLGRVLPVSGCWPVANLAMSKSRKVAQLAEIDGIWHKLVMNKTGYDQWIPCTMSHRDIAHELKKDADLGFVDPHAVVVDHLLHLVDEVLPDDFIAYLRREAEAVSGHRIGETARLKADGDVVKVSVHISFDFLCSCGVCGDRNLNSSANVQGVAPLLARADVETEVEP
jgi:hypothetical protein